MTMKQWVQLRTLFLIPSGAILALLVTYRNDMPGWALGVMGVHTVAVLWLIWMRASGRVRVDRE